MKPGQSLYQVLTAAIADLTEHGFDSQERLDRWLRELGIAARAALIPQEILLRELQGMLTRVYERAVQSGKLLRAHSGISEFTLASIKPKLRAELDRRILASAQLIKLNREASIQRTLQRFAGWATSIPAGGTEVAERREVAATVRRGIAGLPFEERRVVIDQGHKLVSAINDIVATDGGAIAMRWRHVMERGGGYQPRPEHVARNNKIYLIRDSWAKRDGLVKPGPAGYTDEITQPAEEVACRCLPGLTRIPFANVQRVYRRPYNAVLYEIRTASGKSLRLTPNHPVLTSNGWRAADALNVGDHIVESIHQIVEASGEEYEDDAVPTLSEIFDFLAPSCGSRVAQGASHQFHGDGSADSNVDVVSTDWPLRIDGKTSLSERFDQFRFADANKAFSGLSFIPNPVLGLWFAAKTFTGARCSKAFSFFRFIVKTYSGRLGVAAQRYLGFLQATVNSSLRRSVPLAQNLGGDSALIGRDDFFHGQIDALARIKGRLRFGSDMNSSLLKAPTNSPIGHLEALCKLHGIDSGTVRLGQITDIKRSNFSGHVYNLQTEDGWYSAEGIITHNCTGSYMFNLRDLPPEMLTDKGRAELARVRGVIASFGI